MKIEYFHASKYGNGAMVTIDKDYRLPKNLLLRSERLKRHYCSQILRVCMCCLLFIAVPPLVGCSSATVQNDLDVEEYSVYSVLIEAMYCTQNVNLVVVSDHTAVYPTSTDEMTRALEYVEQRMPTLRQETLDDYQAKNNRVFALSEPFHLGTDYVLIEHEEIDRIFSPGESGWEEFYTSYPGSAGIISLSRVGFNPEQNQALVYVGIQRNWLVGQGWYVLLTKDNGTWSIQNKVMMWIS